MIPAVGSASRPSRSLTRPIGTVAAIGFDVYDVVTAPPAQRVRVAAEAVGGLVGGAALGAVGAAVVGPVGAVVLGAVGNWAAPKPVASSPICSDNRC